MSTLNRGRVTRPLVFQIFQMPWHQFINANGRRSSLSYLHSELSSNEPTAKSKNKFEYFGCAAAGVGLANYWKLLAGMMPHVARKSFQISWGHFVISCLFLKIEKQQLLTIDEFSLEFAHLNSNLGNSIYSSSPRLWDRKLTDPSQPTLFHAFCAVCKLMMIITCAVVWETQCSVFI